MESKVKIEIKINGKEFVVQNEGVLTVDMNELLTNITPVFRLTEFLTKLSELQARR